MDCVLKHLFTFIPNATTDEFTWSFILRGITANLEFVNIIEYIVRNPLFSWLVTFKE